jgi:hypothetical protein
MAIVLSLSTDDFIIIIIIMIIIIIYTIQQHELTPTSHWQLKNLVHDRHNII